MLTVCSLENIYNSEFLNAQFLTSPSMNKTVSLWCTMYLVFLDFGHATINWLMKDRCPKSVGDAKQSLEIRVEPKGDVGESGNQTKFINHEPGFSYITFSRPLLSN